MQCVFQGRKELSFRSEVTNSCSLGAALGLAWILNKLQNWPAVSWRWKPGHHTRFLLQRVYRGHLITKQAWFHPTSATQCSLMAKSSANLLTRYLDQVNQE